MVERTTADDFVNRARSKRPNKHGCIPYEDVCLQHDEPLVCDHGCESAVEHGCVDAGRRFGDDDDDGAMFG